MKVVILCGGAGTRIRDVSEVLPKPMLPIGERPILWHIMKIYAQHNIRDFVLCLGYKSWMIKEYFLNFHLKVSDISMAIGVNKPITSSGSFEEDNWKVIMAETGEKAQTGARLFKVRKYLEQDDIMCFTYGDGVGDIDLSALLKKHKDSGLIGTITAVRPLGRFGEIEIEGEKVNSFNEKPNVGAGYINGGFMIFDAKRIWEYFRPGDDLSFESNVLPKLVADKQLGVYKHNGYWSCVDTQREYNTLNMLWENQKAPWKIW